MMMRRRPDTPHGELPPEIQRGDYWKVLTRDGSKPLQSEFPENLTGTCWIIAIPMTYGYALANLMRHTVREHEDGEISVRPGDGSSNSILVTGHHGEQWHGYIEHGVLQQV